MKLLFDENLSRRLVALLADVYAESTHVISVGLERAEDEAIWAFAAEESFVIVSKDDDFRQRALAIGAPPKVVWSRLGNCSTARCATVLRMAEHQIAALVEDAEASVLVLGRGP